MKLAKTYVAKMQSWIGKNEYDGSHRAIVDIYNSHKPLPQGYKMGYYEAWCATTVSAAAIDCGYEDIIPLECSCKRMIDKAIAMGIWNENDAYVPNPGDIILYDWQDSGTGDNAGWPDHVGVVEKIENKQITVIEGNMDDKVGRRTIDVNGKYIRGFICPQFDKEIVIPPIEEKNKSKYVYELLEEMNMRSEPNGTKVGVIPEHTVICGDILKSSGTTQWLYTSYNGGKGYIAVLPESKKWAIEVTTKGESKEASVNTQYYPACVNKTLGIVDSLRSIGVDPSFAHRKQIANANGIKLYTGTANQNTTLVKLLREGKLIRE